MTKQDKQYPKRDEIKIFISSPGDVSDERIAACDLIQEMNCKPITEKTNTFLKIQICFTLIQVK